MKIDPLMLAASSLEGRNSQTVLGKQVAASGDFTELPKEGTIPKVGDTVSGQPLGDH